MGVRYLVAFLATVVVLVIMFFQAFTVSDKKSDEVELILFVDKTLLPLFREVEVDFIPLLEQEAGVAISMHYIAGSSGFVLSQLNLTREGDLYGSDDYTFAKLAIETGLLDPESTRVIGYITLAILVDNDSDLNISGLRDLVFYGEKLRIAVGDPTHVAAGKLAEELLEAVGLWDALKQRHDVVYAASASDVASLVMSRSVDAGLTFDVFYFMNPDSLRLIEIEPELNVRAAPVVVGVPPVSKHYELALRIVDFMASEDFIEVLDKYGFRTGNEIRKLYPHMKVVTLKDIVEG